MGTSRCHKVGFGKEVCMGTSRCHKVGFGRCVWGILGATRWGV